MMRRLGSLLRRFASDERGYVLPMVTIALPIILGAAALGTDYSYVLYVQTRLQASSDQAALAAAQGLADNTYTAKANLYSASAAAGGVNTISGVTVGAPTVATRCASTVKTFGVACVGTANANTVSVTQSATVPLFFGIAQRFTQMTVTATSYATAGGGNFPALNVVIIMDTTSSMNNNDPLCGMTKLACAENGLQSMLGQLYPSIDYVGIEVFPGVTTATASRDYGCSGSPGSGPTIVQYGASAFSGTNPTYTYSIVGLSQCTLGTSGNCYRTSNGSTSLNANSPIVQLAGNSATGTSACLVAKGGMGTFLADAITAAQTQLTAFKTSLGSAGVNTQNVIVVLSDGDANATSGSQIVASEARQQCHEAITAAQAAATAGTWVYSVAYASNTSGGCSTDTNPTITAYCAMLQLASDPKFFYSDTTPPSTACPNGNRGPAASSNIATIFKNIGTSLGSPRLVTASIYAS